MAHETIEQFLDGLEGLAHEMTVSPLATHTNGRQ